MGMKTIREAGRGTPLGGRWGRKTKGNPSFNIIDFPTGRGSGLGAPFSRDKHLTHFHLVLTRPSYSGLFPTPADGLGAKKKIFPPYRRAGLF